MVSVNDCPNEILLRIFMYLSPGESCKCALVCRRWAPLMKPSIWRCVHYSTHPDNNPLVEKLLINEDEFANFVYTTELEIVLPVVSPPQPNRTADDVEKFMRNFEMIRRICDILPPRMERLFIQLETFECDDTTADEAVDLGNYFGDVYPEVLGPFDHKQIDNFHIEYIRGEGAPYTGWIRPGIDLTVFLFKSTLTSLLIHIPFDQKHIPPFMPNLTSLVLDDFGLGWEVPTDILPWEDLSHLRLQYLEIRNNGLEDDMILPQTITTLSIRRVWDYNNAMRLAFYHLQNLQHVILHGIIRGHADPLPVVPQVPIVSTNLETISIGKLPWFPVSIMKQVGRTCTRLRQFRSAGNGWITRHFHANVAATSLGHQQPPDRLFNERLQPLFSGLTDHGSQVVYFVRPTELTFPNLSESQINKKVYELTQVTERSAGGVVIMKNHVPGEMESLELVPQSSATVGGVSDWTKYWELRYINKPGYWDDRAERYALPGFEPYSDDEED